MSSPGSPEKTFHLRVIATDHVVEDRMVRSVKLPAHDGYVGVLPNHAPLIGLLGTGSLTAEGDKPLELFVANGFFQVDHNELRVVCDVGERADEIDLERARAAEKKLREKLAQSMKQEQERGEISAALQRALTRQMMAERRKGHRPESGLR